MITEAMKNRIDTSMIDLVFDNVSQGRIITAMMVAKASLCSAGHMENYLKIESWIISMGYEKKVSGLNVTYVKMGGVSQ